MEKREKTLMQEISQLGALATTRGSSFHRKEQFTRKECLKVFICDCLQNGAK